MSRLTRAFAALGLATIAASSVSGTAEASSVTVSGTWRLESTNATVNCYAFAWPHPSAGIHPDPCSDSIWVFTDVNGVQWLKLLQRVDWNWVASGSGTKVNAVRTVAQVWDIGDHWDGLQVNSINAGYFNGGGLMNTCNCPVGNGSATESLTASTPWVFGVGCGNAATGHTAGDEVWNHANYSTRGKNGTLLYWDEYNFVDGIHIRADTRSSPSFYYFAPRSAC